MLQCGYRHVDTQCMSNGLLPYLSPCYFLSNRGAEAGALARGIVSTPSELFKLLVFGVYIFGFFISPAMVGLWVKSLKDEQNKRAKDS